MFSTMVWTKFFATVVYRKPGVCYTSLGLTQGNEVTETNEDSFAALTLPNQSSNALSEIATATISKIMELSFML